MKISLKTLILNFIIPSIIFVGVLVFSTITIVDEVSSVMQIEDLDIQSKDSSLLSTSMSEGVVLLNNEIYLFID